MRRWLVLAAQFLSLINLGYTKSATGDSVLVVLEKGLKKENFSTFFSGLEGLFTYSLSHSHNIH